MKYFLYLLILATAFYLGYKSYSQEPVNFHTEIVISDTILVNHTDTIKIISQAPSHVQIDTIFLKDTVFVDTAYIVSFDTSTARINISGKTFFRFGNRSTYKLDLWLNPDTVVCKVDFLQDSLKALLLLNNKVLVDSLVYIPRLERKLEWYEKEWLWFGLGAVFTSGIVYLIK